MAVARMARPGNELSCVPRSPPEIRHRKTHHMSDAVVDNVVYLLHFSQHSMPKIKATVNPLPAEPETPTSKQLSISSCLITLTLYLFQTNHYFLSFFDELCIRIITIFYGTSYPPFPPCLWTVYFFHYFLISRPW